MKDIQQLIKKNSQEGRYEDIFPKTFTDAVKDKESGKSLIDILSSFNMYFLSYNGSIELTRLQVPMSIRKTGLWITYVLYDKTVVTEWYAGEAIDDDSWKSPNNWRGGSNMLVGDISISSDGYWVVNGVVTTTKAQGEQGITPMLRVGSNNYLQASYTNGSSWIDVSTNPVYTQFRVNNNKIEQSLDLGNIWTVVSDNIAAWFRWQANDNNLGRIQISRDNNTWENFSPEFINRMLIKGFVANLPQSAEYGDIYMVGPYYNQEDSEHVNPYYRMWVMQDTWVDAGYYNKNTYNFNYNIKKTYPSVSAMDADKSNPIGTNGLAIQIGDIVTVVNSTTPSENGIYSYEGATDGWKYQSSFYQLEQIRSQNTNTAPSSKLFDDKINELAGDIIQVETDLNYMYPSVGTAKRILADAGTIKSRSTLNELTNKFLDLLPNTKLLFCPHLAVKLRESGIYKYVTKLYDIGPAMLDGYQTTALNQPYLSGNIAPNEKYAIKNPNGGSAYITHTPISFSATDKWSVSTMLNDFCSSLADYGAYCGNGTTASNIYLRKSSANRLRFLSNSSVEYLFNVNNSLIGKNSLITFVSFGNGTLNLYLNGKLFQSISSTDTSFIFSMILNSYPTLGLNGDVKYHGIRDIALSTTQVQDEYNYLRTLFPEIESVAIGTQTWATSNCEMTCTPQGNVIQEMQNAANIEKITNAAEREFSSDTGWDKFGGWSISNGTANCNASSWSVLSKSYASNPFVSGKLYRVSFTVVSSISGTDLRVILGNNAVVDASTLVGEKIVYLKFSGPDTSVLQIGSVDFVGSIDNISFQEVGWTDSTNIYNYIYANTTGTAEQKEYTAVKAAAMWRNVNNDSVLASVYGKKFNKYAKRLLAMDIAYYNAANPTALWGWDIPTQAQLTTLASNGGNALKVGGTNYWNTANGFNSTGLTLLGGGYIDASGNYVGNKTHEGIWAKDADIARVALDADNSFNEVAATTEGYSIRLIKV